jgi:hypothetical protein
MEPGDGGPMSLSSGCGGVSKYEEVSLYADETVRDTQDGIARYMTFYNQIRPNRARDGRMPDRVYWENLPVRPIAA